MSSCRATNAKAYPGTAAAAEAARKAARPGETARTLRTRLAFAEIARAEAVRTGRGANGTLPAALNEAWSHGQWLSAEWRKAEAGADAAHAALDALTARIVEVERILERYGAVGCDAALRVIRGEPIVRERP